MNDEELALSRNLSCVSCKETLVTLRSFDGVLIDRCPKCSGTWYDAGELEHMLGDAFNYQALMRTVSSRLSDFICPCCKLSMRALVFKFQKGELVIDHCPTCRGFWLDSGELISVKNLVEAISEGVAPVKTGFSSAHPISRTDTPFSLHDHPLLKDSALEHYRSVDYDTGAEIEQIGVSSYLFAALTALPVEVFNPIRAPAFGLYLLIILNTTVYIYSGGLNQDQFLTFVRQFGATPVEVFAGKFYGLLTSLFIHSSFWHLFANMYFLFVFGDNVYDLFNDDSKDSGPFIFLLFYIVVGVFACLVHVFLISHNLAMATVPLIGASGAVSGVMAAYWRAFPKTKIYQIIFGYPFKVPISLYLGFWVLLNLMLGLVVGAGSRISWQGHLGGFAAGYFLLPYLLPFSLERLQREHK